MENRIKFISGQQRKFLLKVQEISDLKLDELAKIAGVVPRSYRDWKREKLCMGLRAAIDLSSKFNVQLPERVDEMELRWKKFKSEKGKIGGFACLKKYGNPATTEGRKKGGAKTLSILREKGIIPLKKKYLFPKQYNEELAEFTGVVLGDGGLTTGQLQITLNSLKDKEYAFFLGGIGKRLFGEEPKIYNRKSQNAVCLYYNGELLSKYLVKIGLKVGNKVKLQVDVPSWIKSKKNYRVVCLRGLMDTDGGIFIHKYKVNKKQYSYKKICFTNRSLPLLIFVKETLEKLGFTPKLITKVENKKVWLYNEQEVKNYMRIVGSHNERLLRQLAIL